MPPSPQPQSCSFESTIRQHVLLTRWVSCRKLGSDGQIHRYKARFVVRGFEQVHEVDFDETFASVVKQIIFATSCFFPPELSFLIITLEQNATSLEKGTPWTSRQRYESRLSNADTLLQSARETKDVHTRYGWLYEQ